MKKKTLKKYSLLEVQSAIQSSRVQRRPTDFSLDLSRGDFNTIVSIIEGFGKLNHMNVWFGRLIGKQCIISRGI